MRWDRFREILGKSQDISMPDDTIITGPLYSQSHALTFVKNEGKIAIPDSTWKVALIGPRNGDNPFMRANVQSFDDLAGLTLLAVNMPNIAGVRKSCAMPALSPALSSLDQARTTRRIVCSLVSPDWLAVLT